jgi:SAM-dependent methyltransferase
VNLELYQRRELNAIAARWDAKAGTWDQALRDPACHLNEDGAYNRFLGQVRLLVEQRRGFCARQGVIDAGCGTGLVLAEVVPGFAWGLGVDISPEMIRLADGKRIPGAHFLVGDCFELAAMAPPAGAVISRGVLLSHYGPEEGRALLQSARADLVPGGFILFDFLNQAALGRHTHVAGNKAYFLSAEVCHMAQAAGFRAARILGEDERRVLALVAERD